MTHPPSWRSRYTSDEAHRRLVLSVVCLQEVRRIFFSRSPNLSNHDDSIRLFIFKEYFQTVDEICPRERVASNANNKRLPEPSLRRLVHGFVCEGAGSRDNAYPPSLVNETWHDTDLTLARSDDTRAIGTNESCLALGFEDVGDADHVVLGNAFCDANDKWHFSFNSFFNTFSGNWWSIQGSVRAL